MKNTVRIHIYKINFDNKDQFKDFLQNKLSLKFFLTYFKTAVKLVKETNPHDWQQVMTKQKRLITMAKQFIEIIDSTLKKNKIKVPRYQLLYMLWRIYAIKGWKETNALTSKKLLKAEYNGISISPKELKPVDANIKLSTIWPVLTYNQIYLKTEQTSNNKNLDKTLKQLKTIQTKLDKELTQLKLEKNELTKKIAELKETNVQLKTKNQQIKQDIKTLDFITKLGITIGIMILVLVAILLTK